MRYYTALTIAGSDSCGGAGIQADIKTMSALGVYATSAITAITVQNTKGVYGIQNVEPEIVKGQIEAVMEDIHPDAIKIGMVNDCDTIRAIAETLKKYQESFQHLVIDPVMVSTSGCRLMQEDALDVFITELLPLATLLTPNIPEAEILANRKIENVEEINNTDIKKNNKAFTEGGFKVISNDDYVFSYARFTEDSLWIMIASTDSKERKIEIPINIFGKETFSKKEDEFGRKLNYRVEEGKIILKVSPHCGYIFEV